jgi:hypothetical protein
MAPIDPKPSPATTTEPTASFQIICIKSVWGPSLRICGA